MNFPVDLSPPILEKAQRLGVFPQDISENFVRGGGPGGQKINKTASTVVLKHLPTGIEVRCQKHREQSKNRQSAYKLLILKVEEQKLGQQSARAQKIFKIMKQKHKRSKRTKLKLLEGKKRRSEIKEARKKFF